MSKTNKKKMSNGKFLGIWIPCLSLAAIIAIAVPVAASFTSTWLDTAVGRGDIIKTQNENTKDWDTEYNKATTESSAAAIAASESKVEDICDEGFVLLKNKNNNSLPISTSTGITMLGRDSVDPIYGGSGSGTVDASTCATPKSGLEKAGFTVNSDAYDFFKGAYSSYPRASIVMDDYNSSNFFIGEIPTSAYTFTPKTTDVAVVFIGRGGGEGGDLSTNLKRDLSTKGADDLLKSNTNAANEAANYTDDQHELELTVEEKGMISFAESHYSKTIVVINSSNTMELGNIQNDDGVSAIIWVGSPGSTGFNSLGSILSGAVNPSGKTADTWANDFTLDPTFKNFGHNGVSQYDGIDSADEVDWGNGNSNSAYFVEYEEGIYVGYRYYETRFGTNDAAYDNAVVYPFGYGLSYTSFTQNVKSHSEPSLLSSECSVTVTVTNTGSVAGKDVVEVYYSAPYTEGGIQKSSVNLVRYAKTGILAPGESEDITLTWDKSDMASYDYKENKCYVLDGGNYGISIRSSSHDVLDSYSFNLDKDVYNNGRPGDEQTATNQFDDVSAMFKDTATTGYATNMTRDDWETSFPTLPTSSDANPNTTLTGTTTVADELAPYDVNDHNDSTDVTPTTGASNGLSLIDLRGKTYDDPAWDTLLDELTDDDYTNANDILCSSVYVTPAIESIGKPATQDPDGPAGFTCLMNPSIVGCSWMSEVILASTWNQQLAKEMGECVGEESIHGNGQAYSGWYAPAMNTHRSPFGGRNFEYYSEDGVLAGYMAANVVSGTSDKGCYSYIKHFALNDQEYMRTTNLCVWANEQSIREIYLKPFEICVKEASSTEYYTKDTSGELTSKTTKGCMAVMSSFNRIGGTWAGGSEALMTEVLRNEWGFEGVVDSDFNLYGYMDPDQGMRAGTDMQLTWASMKDSIFGGNIKDTSSATGRIAIRKAIKNMCYTVTNSNAMNGIAPGTTISYTMSPWKIWMIVGVSVWSVATLVGVGWVVVRTRKYKRSKDDVVTDSKEA